MFGRRTENGIFATKTTFMKYLSIALLFLTFSAFAQKTTVPAGELPKIGQQLLAKHFAGASVTTLEYDAQNPTTSYWATLSNGVMVSFDINGDWLEATSANGLESTLIPSETSKYLAKKYPGQKVLRVARTEYGFEVDVTRVKGILFHKNGMFNDNN